jgi:hypothetical protein
MTGGITTNKSPTIAAHTPPPYGAGQSQPMAPMHGGVPSGPSAAVGQSGMYDSGSSAIAAPKKSKTGLIVGLVLLLAAGGGIAAVVALGGKKTGDASANTGSGSSAGSAVAINDKGSGSAAGTTPETHPTPDAAVVPDHPNNGGVGSGSSEPAAGSDTKPETGSGTGSNTGSAGTTIAAAKTISVLIASNAPAFDIFEGDTRVAKGPDLVEVTEGTPRTLTLKATGFKPKTITVDGSKTKITEKLERDKTVVKPNNGGTPTNAGSDTTPPKPKDCSRELVNSSDATCQRQYCKTHPNYPACATLDD